MRRYAYVFVTLVTLVLSLRGGPDRGDRQNRDQMKKSAHQLLFTSSFHMEFVVLSSINITRDFDDYFAANYLANEHTRK